MSRSTPVLLALTALLGAGAVASPTAASADTGVDRAVGVDRVRLAPGAAAPAVVRTPQGVVTERLPIPFPVVRRQDPGRYRGTEAVVAPGRTGVLERTYADLGTAGRVLVREQRVREPQSRVVAVGTRVRPTYGGLDWNALAQCESGGDPRAVSRTGKFRGLYQFSLSTWRSVGGTGDPVDHDRDAQTARAYRLFQRDGRAPWPQCGSRL